MTFTETTEPTQRDINQRFGEGENGIWALNRTAEPFDLLLRAIDAGCITNEEIDQYISISSVSIAATQVATERFVTVTQAVEAEIIDLDAARRSREAPYLGYLATAGN